MLARLLALFAVVVSLAMQVSAITRRSSGPPYPNANGLWRVQQVDSIDCSRTDRHCVFMGVHSNCQGAYEQLDGPIPCLLVDDGDGIKVCQFPDGDVQTTIFCDDGDSVDINFDRTDSKFALYGRAQAKWTSKAGTNPQTSVPGDNISIKCAKDKGWPDGK